MKRLVLPVLLTSLAAVPFSSEARQALAAGGVPGSEVRRRLQTIRAQVTEQPEGIELTYDSLYGKPLTGDPKEDGFKTAPHSFLVEAAASLPPGGKALDVGAGMSRNAIHLACLGWAVTAIDLSSEGLKVLQANTVKVETVKTSREVDDLGEGGGPSVGHVRMVARKR